jgi:phenylpropionate dioxygenase-like ring-hydroxylating dioxygenase large terminal subunit
MFEGFANVWTPVLRAKHLKPGKLLPTVVAGEKVVFFRDEKERVRALLDRCPHRGVQLSLGKVENGCVECPFHAWRFDGQGAVVDVPLNPDAKRERLFATALPAREVGGLLWVYTAPAVPQSNGAEPPGFEPEVPVGLTMKGAARTYLEVEWKTHWTRAMENMLDSPHVPFLHKGTIGRFVKPYLKPGSRMDVEWEDTPYGGRTLSSIDGQAEAGAVLDWYRPNTMVLNIAIPGEMFRMHAMCVPIDATRTRMIIVGARTFATLPLLNPFFNLSNKRIAEEDRAVVESSQPLEVPPPSEEVSVRTDKATLQFRKFYYEVLKKSAAAPRAAIRAVA